LQLKELKRQAAPKLRPLLPSQQTPNIANLGASNRMHKMVRAPAYICAVARSYGTEEKTDERAIILGVRDRQRQSTEGAAN
jgi:hypothetical protein